MYAVPTSEYIAYKMYQGVVFGGPAYLAHGFREVPACSGETQSLDGVVQNGAWLKIGFIGKNVGKHQIPQ